MLERTYEVSIWTLQDDFITVLKPSDVEHKGLIQDQPLKIKTDGTLEFSFKLPMYLFKGRQLVENPLWYHTQNGNLIANMRKIKVILNKYTEQEKVFEFLITKTLESHEKDQLYCEVTCEGLAFHELGKIGYKYALTNEEYEADYTTWDEARLEWEKEHPGQTYDETEHPAPMPTIDYWMNKMNILPEPDSGDFRYANQWYYRVSMHNIIDGIEEKTKIFEDQYAVSWHTEGDQLIADEVAPVKEKMRVMNESQSNIYNLTQKLAETFGVFCEYIYGHDENYHINSRTIVFYNSFFRETEDSAIDITYPFHTDSVKRTLDSTDLTTKMFISTPEDDYGFTNILDVEVNPTQEDYILNFDYLHENGTIKDDAYKRVKPFEAKMRDLNEQIKTLSIQRDYYQSRITDLDAKIAVAEKSITKATEVLNQCKEFMAGITQDGIIEVTSANPELLVILQKLDGTRYANLNTKGIIVDTIVLYTTFNSAQSVGSETRLTDKIENFSIEVDEIGYPNKIIFSNEEGKITDSTTVVYATYNYEPKTYWADGVATYERLIAQHNADKAKYTTERDGQESPLVEGYKNKLNIVLNDIKTILTTKNMLMNEFQRAMGPALREGTWSPNDYQDYGKLITLNSETPNGKYEPQSLIEHMYWDQVLIDDENDTRYSYSVEQDKKYHLIVNINNSLDRIFGMEDLTQPGAFLPPSDLCFIYFAPNFINSMKTIIGTVTNADLANYSNPTNLDNQKKTQLDNLIKKRFSFLRYYRQGGGLAYEYIKKVNHAANNAAEIFPSVVISGLQNSSDETIRHIIYYGHLLELSSSQISTYPLEDQAIYYIWHWLDSNNKQYIRDSRGNPFARSWCLGYVQTFTENAKLRTYFRHINTITIDGVTWSELNYSMINTATTSAIDSIYDERDESLPSQVTTYTPVYPRLMIRNNKFKVDDRIVVKYNNTQLTQYEDYYVIFSTEPRSANTEIEDNRGYYMITIKPLALIKNALNTFVFNFNYFLSTAAESIYLDAIKIAKENSQPKTSYEVSITVFPETLRYKLYSALAHIVHINDVPLKFEDVRGYISEVELNLSKPQEDKAVVQNYKNKFEDLFSSIVAQTQAMEKNENIISSIPTIGAQVASLQTITKNIANDVEAFEKMTKTNNLINDYLSEYTSRQARRENT